MHFNPQRCPFWRQAEKYLHRGWHSCSQNLRLNKTLLRGRLQPLLQLVFWITIDAIAGIKSGSFLLREQGHSLSIGFAIVFWKPMAVNVSFFSRISLSFAAASVTLKQCHYIIIIIFSQPIRRNQHSGS